MNFQLQSALIILAGLSSCTASQDRKQAIRGQEIWPANKEIAVLALADSQKLTHVRKQFYKSKSGQLFERTFTDRDNGRNELTSVEYFNGIIPQDIDPFTFEQLDGWFAKDKNNAYYYRPTSGGMQMVTLTAADVKTFKVLKGHYLFAMDNRHVFKETEILENISPSSLQIERDKNGSIIKIASGKTTMVTE